MCAKVALLVMGCELTAAFVGSFVFSTATSLAARRPGTRCLSVGCERHERFLLKEGSSSGKVRLRMAMGDEVAGTEILSPFAAGETELGAGGKQDLEFNMQNVDSVLDTVRPYLIADGGNCKVVDIDQVTGDVSLELEGACGTCPSSTVTLKMGIERALREQFGARLGEVRQVTPGSPDTLTQELVAELLKPVMPAVTGLGGKMEIVGLDPASGAVTIRYQGPEKLTFGIELTLKDHPKINAVTFV